MGALEVLEGAGGTMGIMGARNGLSQTTRARTIPIEAESLQGPQFLVLPGMTPFETHRVLLVVSSADRELAGIRKQSFPHFCGLAHPGISCGLSIHWKPTFLGPSSLSHIRITPKTTSTGVHGQAVYL